MNTAFDSIFGTEPGKKEKIIAVYSEGGGQKLKELVVLPVVFSGDIKLFTGDTKEVLDNDFVAADDCPWSEKHKCIISANMRMITRRVNWTPHKKGCCPIYDV